MVTEEFIPNPNFKDEFAEMIKSVALAKAKDHLAQIHGDTTSIQFSTGELEAEAKRIATHMQNELRK